MSEDTLSLAGLFKWQGAGLRFAIQVGPAAVPGVVLSLIPARRVVCCFPRLGSGCAGFGSGASGEPGGQERGHGCPSLGFGETVAELLLEVKGGDQVLAFDVQDPAAEFRGQAEDRGEGIVVVAANLKHD